MTREHKFLGGTCVSKNFDETVRLQSEIREERLQGIAEGAPRLASSSAASFPGRNECPGTHCSLIEDRSATEFEIRGKMEERTERESDSRREEKWQTMVLPRPAKSVQNGADFSGET